jgi:hypothetical protein
MADLALIKQQNRKAGHPADRLSSAKPAVRAMQPKREIHLK